MGEWSSKEGGAARKLKDIRPSRTAVYAVFGDSLAEGMGYKRAKESLPAGMRGYHVYPVSGEWSKDTLARVKSATIPKGSTVMVFTGTNDLIGVGRGFLGRPARIQARLRQNVRELIRWANENGVQLVLVTVPPCAEYKSPHNAWLRVPKATLRAMEDHNAWLLGQRSEKVMVLDLSALAEPGSGGRRMVPRLTTDGLHPNTKGYVKVAGMLWEELAMASLRGGRPAAVATIKQK